MKPDTWDLTGSSAERDFWFIRHPVRQADVGESFETHAAQPSQYRELRFGKAAGRTRPTSQSAAIRRRYNAGTAVHQVKNHPRRA
jgi:hypothetical protein